MNRQDFTLLMQRHFQTVLDLNERKGNDYAGKDDALANFKSAAEQLGLTPIQVWSVYANKHWQAIMTFVRDGKLESEPIEGRILDEITYLFLLLGLLEEQKPPEPSPEKRFRDINDRVFNPR